jgi:N-acetylmuramic acid 6-phosphate etherase
MSKQAVIKQDLSITESPSNFNDLDKMTVNELLTNINHEDAKVHLAVGKPSRRWRISSTRYL